jgi:hypothetical protein
LLRNPIRGGQGPNWAVEPYDDDDDDEERKKKEDGVVTQRGAP